MSENKTRLKEKLENHQSDLKEILGNIKDVVSEEKQTLSKVDDYKLIKLKRENLIKSGKLGYMSDINHEILEPLIRKIVQEELKKLNQKTEENVAIDKNSDQKEEKPSFKGIAKLRKLELIELCKKYKIDISARHSKTEILKAIKSRIVDLP